MKDHIPDWAGGRRGLHLDSGVERLRNIVSDAGYVNFGPEQDQIGTITVKQAREVLALLELKGSVYPTAIHAVREDKS